MTGKATPETAKPKAAEYRRERREVAVDAHYRHAVEKHPYFCDNLLPFPYSCLAADDMVTEMQGLLKKCRKVIKIAVQDGNVSLDMLLMCELAEVYEAYARKDTAAAVEECYDCIAVLLRMIDVLEGRQELGKPDDWRVRNEGGLRTACAGAHGTRLAPGAQDRTRLAPGAQDSRGA